MSVTVLNEFVISADAAQWHESHLPGNGDHHYAHPRAMGEREQSAPCGAQLLRADDHRIAKI